MYTWLYNEGGFPSGMVCGQILDIRPDLIRINVCPKEHVLKAGEKYIKDDGYIVSFCGDIRLRSP